MEAKFWHERWAQKEIGFHQPDTNPLLVKHLDKLRLQSGDRVFVPLSGKTLDMRYLVQQGYEVLGIELSETAVQEFYAEWGLEPEIQKRGSLIEYHANNVTLYVGDFFDLDESILGPIAAIYDRASLIALPADIRTRYRQHLMTITAKAQQLLLCFDYDQSQMDGPPFSIGDEDIRQYYSDSYKVSLVDRQTFGEPLKGIAQAEELCWVLSPS